MSCDAFFEDLLGERAIYEEKECKLPKIMERILEMTLELTEGTRVKVSSASRFSSVITLAAKFRLSRSLNWV